MRKEDKQFSQLIELARLVKVAHTYEKSVVA